MRTLYDRYAQFFRQRGIPRLAVFGFLARMPIGTAGLATLLHVRELTGSIAFAASVVGAQMIASAASAPIQGRLIDTRGPLAVLIVCGVVAPLAMLVILFAGNLGLPRSGIVWVAVLTGLFTPPVTVVIRTMWRYRFDDEAERRTAFAFDGVLLEIAYTVGPALIGFAVAVSSAQTAMAIAWGFIAAAVPMLVASRGLAWWQRQPPAQRRLLGPLHEPRLVAVYVATFFLTMAFGAMEVGYPGFAIAQGATAWGPGLIAINSIGSAIGGIVYGGTRLRTPVERQLPLLLALLGLPLFVHALLSSLFWMAPWALVAGLLIAPSMTAVAMIVSTVAPAKYATEAFTWSATAIVTGIGAGMAAGGMLVERFGAPTAFLLASGCALLAGLLALRVGRPQQQ